MKMLIAEGIRKLVRDRGLKQEWLAAQAGVPATTLSRIATGVTLNPGIAIVQQIAAAAGVTVGELLGERGFEFTVADRELLTQFRAWADAKLHHGEEGPASQRENLETSKLSPAMRPRLATGSPASTYYSQEVMTELAQILRFRRPQPSKSKHSVIVTGLTSSGDDSGEHRVRSVPDEYWELGARLACEARDNSLADMMINEGDLLFVAPADRPSSEYPAVCSLNGRAVVRFVETLGGGRFLLRTTDETATPISVTPADKFKVYGHVIARTSEMRWQKAKG